MMAQMVKNPPELQETWVRSLGWEDPLEEGWQPTPVFLPGESPWTEEPDMTEQLSTAQHVKENMGATWSNVPTEYKIFSK